MNRIKYLLLLVCIAGCFAACKKDSEEPVFDHLAQFQKDTTAIRAYLKEKGLNSAFVKDGDYGIFYQTIQAGTGDVVINNGSVVTVDYKGSFLDGTEFDSGTNANFTLQNAITSWQVIVKKMKKGEKLRMITPSFYGYRNIPNSRIPANSILDFTITLKNVE